MPRSFRVLAATDGSPSARAALATAVAFPWREPSQARGIVAVGPSSLPMEAAMRAAVLRMLREEAEPARRILARRWSDADVVTSRAPAADAIRDQARRFKADAIVLGWRGHGTILRMLLGSVSRDVISKSRIPVLVARNAARQVRRLVIGFDGSQTALKAVQFLARLAVPKGGRVVVVVVVEELRVPPSTLRLPSGTRANLRREVVEVNENRMRAAREKAKPVVSRLLDAGWRVTLDARPGIPSTTLLRAAAHHKADVLIVGARTTSGLARVLLGSVATASLNQSRIPVLVVP